MQQLTPMRYKDYIWPHNPTVYSISYQRKMATHKVPFGRYCLQDLGLTRRVMRGEGEFVGQGAYEQFRRLAVVFYEEGAGLLVHPVWMAANAFFVSLELEERPRPDYVKYSFEFWESFDRYGQGLTEVTPGLYGESAGDGGNSGSNPDSGALYHTVVRGDTLWGIARTCGAALQTILALNPGIKNPNLIHPGEQVRVR